jgi:hypothetical protein
LTHRHARTAPALLLSLILALASLATGCGEPTDRPEDCNGDEFFDEVSQLCTACPVVDAPECRFGFSITPDEETSCPVAVCDATSPCATYERFDETTLGCTRACPEGATPDASGACAPCPEPTCALGAEGCELGEDGCGVPVE